MTRITYKFPVWVLAVSILFPYFYLMIPGNYLTQAGAAGLLILPIAMLTLIAFSKANITKLKARRTLAILALAFLIGSFITHLYLIDLGKWTWTIYGVVGNSALALTLITIITSFSTIPAQDGP